LDGLKVILRRYVNMKVSIILKAEDFRTWVKSNDLSTCAIDFECVDINYLTLQIAGWSLYNGSSVCYVDVLDNPQYSELIYILKDICKNNIETLIAHNFSFDGRILRQLDVFHTDNIFCTMTAEHLLNESGKKGLKHLAEKHLHIDNSEIMSFEYAVENGFHSNRFYNYATSDSVWTYLLYKIQVPKLKEQELWDLWYNIERPFQFCLMDMKINGALIDQNAIKGLRAKLQAIIDKLEIAMYEAGGISYICGDVDGQTHNMVSNINLNSPAQLSELLLSLGVKLTEKTKSSKLHPKGQYSTKEAVLNSVKNQHEFVVLLLDYRKAISLMNKFLKPLPEYVQSDGRIRANFHNTVCVTGRLSCSHPNLQQLPK